MIMNEQNLKLLRDVPVSVKSEESSESKQAYKRGIKRFDNNDYY